MRVHTCKNGVCMYVCIYTYAYIYIYIYVCVCVQLLQEKGCKIWLGTEIQVGKQKVAQDSQTYRNMPSKIATEKNTRPYPNVLKAMLLKLRKLEVFGACA